LLFFITLTGTTRLEPIALTNEESETSWDTVLYLAICYLGLHTRMFVRSL